MLKVDVFVASTAPFHLIQMRRRVLQAASPDGQTTFYVSSAEDTVLAKLQYSSFGHPSLPSLLRYAPEGLVGPDENGAVRNGQ